ncbi:HD-domain/PDEase-like protein [Ramaria rubella]|nr:HD-domain/PDEase-like protein [Ramaria rubella]
MSLPPTSPSVSSSSSSSSSASGSTLTPAHALSSILRRRSVDTGGLNLAVNDHAGSGSGRGYGGWVEQTQEAPGSIDVAELVIAMREETNSVINQAYPATSTTIRPSSETDAQRESYIRKLATWHFDASHLPHDQVLLCTTLLFELLWSIEGMEEDIGLMFDIIPPFLARVSKIYREQTSYHNFQHALDVLQAIYCYLCQADCIPSVEILLDGEQTDLTPLFHSDLGKGKARASPAADVLPTAHQSRKIWRRPQPKTLLQRTLRNQDLFALFVAAIGHDIGHPGLSNAFMKNAKTPLAELFDDASVLEKMHCTLLLQVMRKHRMGHLLDRRLPHMTHESSFSSVSRSRSRTESDPGVLNHVNGISYEQNENNADALRSLTPLPMRPVLKKSVSTYHGSSESAANGTGTEFRSLLVKTILATDMSVHFQWMPKFAELHECVARAAENVEDFGKTVDEVDFQSRLLLCQALIKCADISNPSRPPPACKHWSWSLLAEWTEQALLEKKLELPISVCASDDPKVAALGQIGFITSFTSPLLVTTSTVIPEMEIFGKQCDDNLAMWKTKVEELDLKASMEDSSPLNISPPASESNASSPLTLPTSPPDVSTMFPLSLPAMLYTPHSETRQPFWPPPDPSTSPPPVMTRPEIDEIVQIGTGGIADALIAPVTDSILPSPSNTAGLAHGTHRRHTSHTELPQVSIPSASSMSPSHSHHAKSSSTTASTSPLFSPRSMPTSSSSPRSEASGSISATSSLTSMLGLQFHAGLRAAYDAHGRPNAIKRLENRTSWQGSVPLSASAAAMSDWGTSTVFDPTVPRQASHGS